jgi:DNA-binding transcriptional LysR family regulator
MPDRFRTARIDWEDARYFAALARHGSLSATARALGVNHATVARRIAALEDALRVKLFERRPTGYRLTAAGRSALTATDAMESAAAALTRLKPGKALGGLVRITTTPSLAEAFLIPRMMPLHQEHPLLDLEITSARTINSLNRYQADVALRLGQFEQVEVVARRVANLAYRFYATPQWRDRLETGGSPIFVGFDEAGAEFPESLWLARTFASASLALRCNNQTGQIAAARAGFGIALLPKFLASHDPDLVEVDLSVTPPERQLFLVTRRDVHTTPRIRVVVDYLLDLIRRERALLEEVPG